MGLSLKKLIGRFYKTSEWKEIEYFDEKWKKRISQMSKYIKPGDSVVDYGCGQMWLKDFLDPTCAYYGVDYCDRGDGTIICDFNKMQFPAQGATAAFVSGCIEYVENPGWFISNIVTHHSKCVISYCCTDNFPDMRHRNSLGWKNHLTKAELISLFENNGMHLSANEATETKNEIFFFIKVD